MAEFTSQLVRSGSCPTENVGSSGSTPLESHKPITNPTNAADPSQRSTDSPLAAAYVIQTRFCKAIKMLRSSFEAAGLMVVSEVDTAASVRTTLGMDLSPSALLSVTCPFLLLEALVMEPALLTIVPLHIVVVEKEHWTRIYVPNTMRLGSDVSSAFIPKLQELSGRIRQCLDPIAARIPAVCPW